MPDLQGAASLSMHIEYDGTRLPSIPVSMSRQKARNCRLGWGFASDCRGRCCSCCRPCFPGAREVRVRGPRKRADPGADGAASIPQDFQILCKGTGWHPKVITKLLAIGRDKRLVPLLPQLPGSYSAIYPFTTLTDAELNLAVSEGTCRPDASSREVLDWIKVKRLEGMDLPETLAYVGTSVDPLSKERKAALLAALQQAALSFGVTVVEGSAKEVGTRKATKASRETIAQQLLHQLTADLTPVVEEAPQSLLQEFEVTSAEDLATGEIRTLTGVLVRLAGSSEGMWESYGPHYCRKVALEFNRTESRAQRFNYRKRLLEVKGKHQQLADLVDALLEYQMN